MFSVAQSGGGWCYFVLCYTVQLLFICDPQMPAVDGVCPCAEWRLLMFFCQVEVCFSVVLILGDVHQHRPPPSWGDRERERNRPRSHKT